MKCVTTSMWRLCFFHLRQKIVYNFRDSSFVRNYSIIRHEVYSLNLQVGAGFFFVYVLFVSSGCLRIVSVTCSSKGPNKSHAIRHKG